MDPRLVQLGEAIVTTAIKSAVKIVQQRLGETTLTDGATVEETIDLDENVANDVTSRLPSDEPINMIESVESIQERRKRVRVSEEMELSSQVKRSREELFASPMTVSVEPDISEDNSVVGTQTSVVSNKHGQNSITHQHPDDEPMDGVCEQGSTNDGIRERSSLSCDVLQWTVDDVGVWLLYIGMGKYQEMFHGTCVVLCEICVSL